MNSFAGHTMFSPRFKDKAIIFAVDIQQKRLFLNPNCARVATAQAHHILQYDFKNSIGL